MSTLQVTSINTSTIDAGDKISAVVYKNPRTLSQDLTILNGENVSMIGPISIDAGKTLTVENNTRFIIT